MDINKPRFELTSIYSDGTVEKPQIVPINNMPWDTNTNRRGFLGTGLIASVALVLFANCKKSNEKSTNTSQALYSQVNAHCNEVNLVLLSPDGRILASMSKYNGINLWSMPGENLLNKLDNGNITTATLAYNPGGTILASPSYNGGSLFYMNFWSLPNGNLLKKTPGYVGTNVLNISSDGSIMASGDQTSIRLWSLPSGDFLRTLTSPYSGMFHALSFSPNSMMLASSAWDTQSFDTAIRIWSLPDGNLLRTLQGHSDSINRLIINPTGNMLISGSFDKTIKLWSFPGGNLLNTLQGHSDRISDITISPNGNILASASVDKTIKLWSLPVGNLLSTLSGHSDFIVQVIINPAGNILVSASWDKTIKLWSLPDGNLLKTFDGHTKQITAISISPDGKTLFSSSLDQTIRLWDLEKKAFIGFLFDPACNENKAVTYNLFDNTIGIIRTYTLPCGSPIPAGATCTCNCVAGTLPPSGGGGGGCTCNTVCTCVPVCQAHKLLHSDKFVRSLSREILLFMGVKEIDYMNWAADNSNTGLRTVIASVIKEVKRGVKPNYQSWPTINECQQYLQNDDEVISVMAAQMINLQSSLRKQVITEDLYQKVESLLIKSEEMHWKKRFHISNTNE